MYRIGIVIGRIFESEKYIFPHTHEGEIYYITDPNDDNIDYAVFETKRKALNFIRKNVKVNGWLESNLCLFYQTYCMHCAKLYFIPLDKVHPDDFGYQVNVMDHFKCTNPDCKDYNL